MSYHADFPVDLPDAPADDPPALRWTATVIGGATLILLLTNAIAISSWGAELAPSATVVRFVNVADGWHAFTDRAGLGAPRKDAHALWKKLEAARFPGQGPAAAAQPSG
jgi:hypothetical protein